MSTRLGLNDSGQCLGDISKDTLTRFREARHRSKRRMGRTELQNHEFLKLLLDVWEEYEEPQRFDDD